VTAAAWVTAVAGLFTAMVNGVAWIRHGREDKARFADHAGQLEAIAAHLGLPQDGTGP
jgi:hypothetical protein